MGLILGPTAAKRRERVMPGPPTPKLIRGVCRMTEQQQADGSGADQVNWSMAAGIRWLTGPARTLILMTLGAVLGAGMAVTVWPSAESLACDQRAQMEARLQLCEDLTANPAAGPLSFHFRPRSDGAQREVLLQLNLRFFAQPGEQRALQARFAVDWDRIRARCLRCFRSTHVDDFDGGEREQRLFAGVLGELNREMFPGELQPAASGRIHQAEVLALFVR